MSSRKGSSKFGKVWMFLIGFLMDMDLPQKTWSRQILDTVQTYQQLVRIKTYHDGYQMSSSKGSWMFVKVWMLLTGILIDMDLPWQTWSKDILDTI